eukprot:COSAG02_NODE_2050_length_10003_cov_585.950525_5_plen_157_part_00
MLAYVAILGSADGELSPPARLAAVAALLHPLSTASCAFLLLMQVEGDEKKAKTSARAPRRQSVAAAAAASITTDKLGEFERRVDIVASFLALNHKARSVDDSVPADTFWLSCCCCCLSLRSGSITAARITSRRPAPSFHTCSTDQERRKYVALATP